MTVQTEETLQNIGPASNLIPHMEVAQINFAVHTTMKKQTKKNQI